MISLTPAAIEKVKVVLGEQEEAQGLRIAVVEMGCSGPQYKMKLERSPGNKDEVIEIEGLKLFVDRQSLEYLKDASIDYIDENGASGFKFENSNARPSCGCGETFEA
jgi:iron-sulfur cluster assembly protein